MTVTDLRPGTTPGARETVPQDDARLLGWRRVRGAVTAWALVAAAVAALGETGGTVVAGRVAGGPTSGLVRLLALCLIGAAVLDTASSTAWSAVVDRAEGRLRADLLSAAMHQPLAVLSETAVGEVLDRIDDDTHELGALLRRMGWDLARTLLRSGPMWVVAGLTWWPAWPLFPLVAVVIVVAVRPLTSPASSMASTSSPRSRHPPLPVSARRAGERVRGARRRDWCRLCR